MISSTCRVCLSSNSQNKIIADTQLQTIFEILTNKQLISNDGRPESVCFLCHAVLDRCCKFVKVSQKSEEFLSQIIRNRVKLTEDILLEREERNSVQGPFKLSISNFSHVSVSIDYHRVKECKDLVIKIEPNQKYVVLEPNSAKENPKHKPEMKYDNEENSNESQNSEVHKRNEYKIEKIKPSLEIKEILKVEFEKNNVNKKPRLTPNDENAKTHGSKLAFDESKQIPIQEKQLRYHLEENKSKKPLYCEYCLKNFKSKQYFKRHMRIHTGEKPYTCKYCKESYRDSVLLKQHVRDHLGNLFVCDVCAKRFKIQQHLKEHYKTHSGEKPFSCDKCPMTFAYKNSLVRHVRTHTGEKPYICDRCSKQFSQTSNLRKHQRSFNVDGTRRRNACNKCACNKDHGNKGLQKASGHELGAAAPPGSHR